MIIQSILDTDLYKFTTSYAYMKMYPDAEGTFSFTDRDNTEYTEEFVEELRRALCDMHMLYLTAQEKDWCIANIRFIPQVYWEWLSSFNYNSKRVQVSLDENKHLHIEVTDKLYKVTLYEVPILALVSQLRNKMLGNHVDMEVVINILAPKISLSNINGLNFSEFGTRRRFSAAVQEEVIKYIKEHSTYCTGTSNVYFAMKWQEN